MEQLTGLYKSSNLCALMEGLKVKRIIDFGCGLGDNLAFLARHLDASEAVGIDISSAMIGYAGRNYPGYKFVLGGIEELENYRADLVTFIDVLEHMDNIPAALQSAGNSGRYIGIKVPLERTWLIRVLNSLHLKENRSRFFESEGHLYEFSRRDVERLLRQAGLKILRARTAFMPKDAMFSEHRMGRMKAKKGRLAKLKYCLFVLLGKLPYAVVRQIFQSVDGVDFFVLCES